MVEQTSNKDEFNEIAQWSTDNERLLRAGLMPTGPGPLDYDEETVDAVKKRCIKRFGQIPGSRYFQTMLATFPERNKELFPELFDEEGNPY